MIKFGKDIYSQAVRLFYLKNKDISISPDKYKPATYEQWVMLKELEPSKFLLDYGDYVLMKQEQHEQEIEENKNVSMIMECSTTIVGTVNFKKDIIETANKIRKIQNDKQFIEWLNIDDVEDVLNYEKLINNE